PDAMRPAARFLGRIVRGLGWVAFVAVALLFVAEKTGILTAITRRIVVARLGEAGQRLRIGGVELGWFDSSIRVTGLELGEEGSLLRVQEARLRYDLRGLFSSR